VDEQGVLAARVEVARPDEVGVEGGPIGPRDLQGLRRREVEGAHASGEGGVVLEHHDLLPGDAVERGDRRGGEVGVGREEVAEVGGGVHGVPAVARGEPDGRAELAGWNGRR
jgi:hypothetical protein